ncbi:MAG: hypothetical protein FWC69_04270 [Defluviitaleaceae bacterium]|nr:hypothetical protein [Defluviitaleaceae bacterium]
MKNRLKFFMLSLAALFVLAACNGEKIEENLEEASQKESEAVEVFTVEFMENIPLQKTYSLWSNAFIGEGSMLTSCGDGMAWYSRVFSWNAYQISTHVMDLAGGNSFNDWLVQFEYLGSYGYRNIREANLINFIKDSNISFEGFIILQEQVYGMSIQELDEKIARARIIDDYIRSQPVGSVMLPAREIGYGYIPTLGIVYIEEMGDRGFFATAFDSSDIAALFSNNITKLWSAFPGYGVYQSGRAYSPEWLLNNTERAIYGELIPLGEFDRIINMASHFEILDDIVDKADTQIGIAHHTLQVPAPFTLSFNTNTTGRAYQTMPSITINAWEPILPFLEANHVSSSNYELAGWYFDDALTIPITDTFRMPSRDVTLYGRWKPVEQ